jgi:hypothetical protein
MQDEVLAYGFDPTAYRARVKIWLNDAQSAIAPRVEIPELFTGQSLATIAGTQSYTLNTNIVRINFVFMYDSPVPTYADRVPLTPATYKEVITEYANNELGFPEKYALDTLSVVFGPTPDAAYNFTIGYYKSPTDLAGDSDVSILTPAWHKAMIRYTVAEAFMAEDDQQMHAYHYGRFEQALGRMTADRQHEINDGPVQVPGTWGAYQ